MSSDNRQNLSSGRSPQQHSVAPRVDHVAQSTTINRPINTGSEQQQSSALLPGSMTTTTTKTQHPSHLQPIAPAGGMALASASSSNSGPPLILSNLAQPASRQQSQPVITNSRHTPAIFQNTRYRAGKWIPEEETYAELLISFFEKGRIVGCENGTTLRSYLSQKLHCSPMRISKKYAGKGIGKMVYVAKVKSGGNEDTDGDKEHEALVKRVKAAEEKFYRAVFPLSDPFLGAGAGLLPMKSLPLFNGMFPMFPPATQALPFAMPPNLMNKNNPFPPALNNPVATTSSFLQLRAQVQQQQSESQPPQQQLLIEPPPLPPTTAPILPTFPAQGIKVTDNASDLRQSFLRALQESEKKEAPKDNSNLQQHQLPQSTHTTVNNTCIANKGGVTLQKNHRTTVDQRCFVKTTPHDLPDFLSGFERAVKNAGGAASRSSVNQQTVPEHTNEVEAYSPTYTTRSFDDLHCLLGKGLPPALGQTLSAAKPATATAARLHPRGHPPGASPEPQVNQQMPGSSDTNGGALFTAESYAMFAQESARAASEHDAYLTSMGLSVEQQPKNESLDIEGMVNLVSEHVVSHTQKPPEQGENAATATTTAQERENQASIVWTKRTNQESSPPPPSTVATGMKFPIGSTYISVVSASEPATETESNVSSFRGSTSGSDNTDNNSTSEGNTDNNSSEGSDSEDSRKRKQDPDAIEEIEQRICGKKARQTRKEGRHQ